MSFMIGDWPSSKAAPQSWSHKVAWEKEDRQERDAHTFSTWATQRKFSSVGSFRIVTSKSWRIDRKSASLSWNKGKNDSLMLKTWNFATLKRCLWQVTTYSEKQLSHEHSETNQLSSRITILSQGFSLTMLLLTPKGNNRSFKGCKMNVNPSTTPFE
jgi:hypothetical protein